MRFLKIAVIMVVGALCIGLSVHFTNQYVGEKQSEEKTLAEAIIQNQLKQELEKAEKEAEKVLGTALSTTKAETKPATSKTTATSASTTTSPPATTTAPIITTAQSTTSAEQIVTEFTRGNILPQNRENIGFKTMFTLSAGEQERLSRFLIDHYFLDGVIYAANETRPELKAKKTLGSQMENNAIAALNLVLESVNLSDIKTLVSADYDYLSGEIVRLRDEFEASYSNASDYGESFGRLYESSVRYFDRLISAVSRFGETAKKYSESSNEFLAALVLAGAVEEVFVPEILAVLEESFDLIEISHEIFLEGTTGTKLLSREEVTEIITNPALVLDTGLA